MSEWTPPYPEITAIILIRASYCARTHLFEEGASFTLSESRSFLSTIQTTLAVFDCGIARLLGLSVQEYIEISSWGANDRALLLPQLQGTTSLAGPDGVPFAAIRIWSFEYHRALEELAEQASGSWDTPVYSSTGVYLGIHLGDHEPVYFAPTGPELPTGSAAEPEEVQHGAQQLLLSPPSSLTSSQGTNSPGISALLSTDEASVLSEFDLNTSSSDGTWSDQLGSAFSDRL